MRLVGMSERILMIDGEYIHIVPASGGKITQDGSGKTTTVHFSNVIGCKVPRKHPTNVKVSFTVFYSVFAKQCRVFGGRGCVRRWLTIVFPKIAGGVQGDRKQAV